MILGEEKNDLGSDVLIDLSSRKEITLSLCWISMVTSLRWTKLGKPGVSAVFIKIYLDESTKNTDWQKYCYCRQKIALGEINPDEEGWSSIPSSNAFLRCFILDHFGLWLHAVHFLFERSGAKSFVPWNFGAMLILPFGLSWKHAQASCTWNIRTFTCRTSIIPSKLILRTFVFCKTLIWIG